MPADRTSELDAPAAWSKQANRGNGGAWMRHVPQSSRILFIILSI
jgi:hypothetical protein